MPGQNFKIAICISGLTRTWNELVSSPGKAISMAGMMKDLQERGHTVHMYGHYWTHDIPPLPPLDQEFHGLYASSEDLELRQWISEDILGRAVLNDKSFNDLQLYKQEYNLDSFDKINQWLIDETVAAIGGYFQNCLCMERIEWQQDYDIIIRARWDTIIEVSETLVDNDIDPDQNLNFLKKNMYGYIESFAGDEWPYSGNHNPKLLLPSSGYIRYSPALQNRFFCRDQPEDIFFVLKNTPCNRFLATMKEKTWKQDTHNIISSIELGQRCGHHNMWNTSFQINSLTASYILPALFRLCRKI